MGKLFYGHTNSNCQHTQLDSQEIISLIWHTTVLFSVIIDHAYDIFRFFAACITLGWSTKVRGGLKDSSHECFRVTFRCKKCRKKGVRTIEFGPYGCRMVKKYYRTVYKTKMRCFSKNMTFGDIRLILNYWKKNMGHYDPVTNHCYNFCVKYSKSFRNLMNAHPFIMVHGSNGYTYNLPIHWTNNNGSSKAVKLANEKSEKLSVVSLGSGGRACTVFENGYAQWNAHKKFTEKMNSIKTQNIRQISFGADDTWIILMSNGWCHYYVYVESGPKAMIDKYNGSIKYVAMSALREQWVVGVGRNGYCYKGICNDLITRLDKNNADNKATHFVEFGKTAGRYVMRDENGWEWMYTKKGSDFSKYFHTNDVRIVALQ